MIFSYNIYQFEDMYDTVQYLNYAIDYLGYATNDGTQDVGRHGV